MVIGAASVVALAAIVVIANSYGKVATTPLPAQPSPTLVASVGPTPTVPPTPTPTGSVASRLMDRIPDAIRNTGTCTADAGGYVDVLKAPLAGFKCQAMTLSQDQVEVWYLQYANAADVENEYADVLRALEIARGAGDVNTCKVPSEGTWSYAGGVAVGRITCYTNKFGAWIYWYHSDLALYMAANMATQLDNGDSETLRKAWDEYGPVP